ncbi:MAG: hypothetical protein LBE91_14080, partial [Tannerella sp.]|nr:hypothetical protein [Tannerella sp.]
ALRAPLRGVESLRRNAPSSDVIPLQRTQFPSIGGVARSGGVVSVLPFTRSPVHPLSPNRFASLGVIHVYLLRRCFRASECPERTNFGSADFQFITPNEAKRLGVIF